jgi:membrane carboxypeptidase/penicillin-binding protein
VTGTTDNFKDADAVIFTPTIAAGLWVGDILGINRCMTYGSDGVFVATPGLHTFIDQTLAGLPGNLWYTKPADVVEGANDRSWFLVDTTSIAHLPGDNPPIPSPKPLAYYVP